MGVVEVVGVVEVIVVIRSGKTEKDFIKAVWGERSPFSEIIS